MALKGSTNEEKIWNYLMSKFNNPYGVAGLMGNLYAESGFRPENLQNSYEKSLKLTDIEYTTKVDNGTYTNFVKDKAGYGLAQWTYWSRKQNLLNFAKSKKKSIGDLEMQLDFLYQELQGYKSVFSTIQNAKTILEASNAVLLQFERPADQSVSVQSRRAEFGKNTYDKFTDKTTSKEEEKQNIGGTTNMSNSSLVNCTVKSPNHSGKRTHSIDRITPHCVVGQLSAEGIGGCFTSTSRQASCNYGIGPDGRVCLIVDEENRSWCSSSNANDQRAVTIEVASDKTAPYAFKDAAYNKLVDLCEDICRRNGKKKLLWIENKDTALNYNPKSDEMLLTVHRWFANKSCPGDWMFARMGNLANEVTRRLGGTATEAPQQPAQPSNPPKEVTNFPATPFMVRVLVDDLNIRTQPAMGDNVIGVTGKGSFTIVEVKDGWGLLKSYADKKNGYIYLANPSYVTISNSIAVETPPAAPPKAELKDGDVIKLKAGATYYNGKSIPGWVFNSTLYYRGKNNQGIIFSTQKTGAITGVVSESSIEGNVTSTSSSSGFKPYIVKVTVDALNIRKGPSAETGLNGVIRDRGSYTIVEQSGNWGKLKSGAGWICLDYTKRV